MKKQIKSLLLVFFILFTFSITQGCKTLENNSSPEILIIGGGASGISAGVTSARMGVETVIVEETEWLGGMLTSAGVSAIDGNYKLPSGFWGEFKDSLINYYGSPNGVNTGWVSNVLFEPSVGNIILQNIAKQERNLKIYFKSRLKSIEKTGGKWKVSIETPEKTITLNPMIVIDATELGDVAKLCGVKYDIGMESRDETREDVAPEKANDIIQDLTYVAILKDYGRDVTIPQPENYDPSKFFCTCVNPLCVEPDPKSVLWLKEEMITYGKLPNNKYMINWPIKGNDYYVNIIEKSEEERERLLNKAKHHTLCYLYFMQTELGFNTLGLADDEYPTKDLLPFIPYHRESRRIHGLVRFDLNHINSPYNQLEKLYRTAIAVGDYPVDHHHTAYPDIDSIPRLNFHPVPSYGLPLGVMIPQEVEGLIVAEKSISVSNIVNGTTRLQPVVLQIGHASGVLASLAIKNKVRVSDVSVREVQRNLLRQGGYLLPYLDVEKGDKFFLPLQRIGVTGILKGIGKNEGWSNQTWFRKDDKALWSDLVGLKDVYSNVKILDEEKSILLNDLVKLIGEVANNEQIALPNDMEVEINNLFNDFGVDKPSFHKELNRGEVAVLIDYFLKPFDKEVDIKGYYKN